MAHALLVTNDTEQSILFISVDVAGFFYEFVIGVPIKEIREAIARALQPRLDIQPHQIIIASSHTHAGTDLSGINQDLGEGIDRALLEDTRRTLVSVAREAAEALRPATLAYLKTTLNGWTRRDNDCSPILDNSLLTSK